MDSIEKLLPILVLGVVTAILLVLLRRKSGDQATLSGREEAPKPVVTAPAVAASCETRQAAAPTLPAARKTRAKRPMPPAPIAPPSTIETVLNLLHNDQALAAAFLLREVFAPPVSRRARLPCDR